jgi:hypothetical protein
VRWAGAPPVRLKMGGYWAINGCPTVQQKSGKRDRGNAHAPRYAPVAFALVLTFRRPAGVEVDLGLFSEIRFALGLDKPFRIATDMT